MNVTLSKSSESGVAPGNRRWLMRAALLSGIVLLFGGYGFHPDLPPATAEALTAVEPVRDQFIWSKLAVAAGGLLMIPMLIAIWRTLISGRGRVLGLVAMVAAGIGLAFNSLSQAVHGYLLWWATTPGLGRSAAVDFVLAAETPSGLASSLVSYWSVPLFGLGLLLFGIALWRAGTVPRWVAPGIIIVTVLASVFAVGPPVFAVGVLAMATFGKAVAALTARTDMPS